MDNLTFLAHLQQKQALIHQNPGREATLLTPSQRLGQYLTAARHHSHLTLQELAMLTELSTEHLMALENGLIPPAEIPTSWLGRVAAVLETDEQTLHFLLRPELNLHPRPEAKPGQSWSTWPTLTLDGLLEKLTRFGHRLRHPRQWSIPMVIGLVLLAFILFDLLRLGWATYQLRQKLTTHTQNSPSLANFSDCVGLGCDGPSQSYAFASQPTSYYAFNDSSIDVFVSEDVQFLTPGLSWVIDTVPVTVEHSQTSVSPPPIPPYFEDGSPMAAVIHTPAGQTTPAMLIQKAQVQIQVSDPAGVQAQLLQVVQQHNGQLITQRSQTANNQTVVYLEVQVEPAQLMALVQAIKQTAGGFVLLENITSRDVTKQVVDLTAQITNLELTETELQQLLTAAQENGNSAGEVLEIFTELSTIRGSIERAKGELNLLNQQVAWSIVEIELRQDAPLAELPGFSPQGTFQKAWQSLVVVGQWLATAGIWLLVYSPLLLGLGGLYQWQQWRKKG